MHILQWFYRLAAWLRTRRPYVRVVPGAPLSPSSSATSDETANSKKVHRIDPKGRTDDDSANHSANCDAARNPAAPPDGQTSRVDHKWKCLCGFWNDYISLPCGGCGTRLISQPRRVADPAPAAALRPIEYITCDRCGYRITAPSFPFHRCATSTRRFGEGVSFDVPDEQLIYRATQPNPYVDDARPDPVIVPTFGGGESGGGGASDDWGSAPSSSTTSTSSDDSSSSCSSSSDSGSSDSGSCDAGGGSDA